MKTDATFRAKPITRRTKVLTLIPGLLASGAATTLVLTMTGVTPAVTIAAANTPLPGGASVPVQVIQDQATVSDGAQVAPAVPNGNIESIVATTRTSGIPAVALNAYQHAAQVINASDSGCHMPWQLIAAIGRVESDHGQYGGSQLDATGEATPAIYGPLLDGQNGMALIKDTDGGALDGNSTYDRAIGPMQFLPSTWNVVGVDGNSDGKRDPQNIYDASLAAAVYLCSGRSNMNNPGDVQSAIYRYNHSDAYVALVTAIMNAYKAGNYTAYPTIAAAAAPTARPAASSAAPPPPPASSSSAPPSNSPTTAKPSESPSPTGSATAAPGTPMTAAQASSYCQSHMNAMDPTGLTNLFNNANCTKKLTGMTPEQADAGWAAHKSNLGAWFTSPN